VPAGSGRALAWAAVAGLLALAVTVPAVGFVVLVLAGPHSDLLPGALQPFVLLAGWGCVLGVPVAAARWAWRRAKSR
jgi:hypothetical protein